MIFSSHTASAGCSWIVFGSFDFTANCLHDQGSAGIFPDTGSAYHSVLHAKDSMNRYLIAPQNAARALRTMLANKRWLPRAESERLIKKWEINSPDL